MTNLIKGTGGTLSYPSSINADYAGNIWVTSTTFTDTTGTTAVFEIPTTASTTASPVSGLTFSSATYVGAQTAPLTREGLAQLGPGSASWSSLRSSAP